ncbi:MAG: family 10 glycosylhydrolase [Candidatus Bathyarchaeia archaeon]
MLCMYATTRRINTIDDAKRMILNCSAMGVKKIFLLTKESGIVYYRSDIAETDCPQGFDVYEAVCEEARKAGIETHAWFCLYIESKERPSKVVKEHPECLLVNRYGKSEVHGWGDTAWVCPSSLVYREYLSDLMEEVTEKYGVDGIHLDYVRYPDVVEGRYVCYCPTCRRKFKQEYGYELPSDDVIKNRYYASILCDNVTEAVEHFSKLAKINNRQTSAYVFTDYVTAIEACYQDWPYFSRFLDMIMPTLYEVSQHHAQHLIEKAKSVVASGCQVVPAVYVNPSSKRRSKEGGNRWWRGVSTENVLSTIEGALRGGADGISLFLYDSLFDSETIPTETRDKLLNGFRAFATRFSCSTT